MPAGMTLGLLRAWGSNGVRSRAVHLAATQAQQKPAEHNAENEEGSQGGDDTEYLQRAMASSLKHDDYFRVAELFTLRRLFEARVHLGHKSTCRNRLMKPYLFGSRLGQDIIDLDRTAKLLRTALSFTAHVTFRKGCVLFVTSSRQHGHMVELAAKACGQYAYTRPWQEGLLTNAEVQLNAEGSLSLPNLLVFFGILNNVFEPHIALREAVQLCIPVVGIVDTNSDPSLVTYPVPANDDSHSSISLFCDLLCQAANRGKARHQQLQAVFGSQAQPSTS
uniref:small ribosomal subunit protein uS2m isoform X2 n=1 Tax=Myxine glutinosa TaxID=7769 RepID=UPI00358FDD1B